MAEEQEQHPHFAASAPVSRAPSAEDDRPNIVRRRPSFSRRLHFTPAGSNGTGSGNAGESGSGGSTSASFVRHGPTRPRFFKTYGREIPHPYVAYYEPGMPNYPTSSSGYPSTFPSGKPKPPIMGLGRPMPTPEEKVAYDMSKSAWEQQHRDGAGHLHRSPSSPMGRTVFEGSPESSETFDGQNQPPYVLVTPETLAKIAPNWIKEQARSADAKKAAGDLMDEKPESSTKELQTVPSSDLKPQAPLVEVDDDEESLDFPNPWAKIRYHCREPFAEFIGTMLLIIFGNGVNNQYFLTGDPNVSDNQQGTYLSVSWGWGLGVCMGVYVSGGISGGHINPAVTLTLAIFRGFPWKKVPIYWFAQLLGAFCGACIIFGLYQNAINIYEGGADVRTIQGDHGTAQLFATYPQTYLSNVSCFFQEFTDTAVLLIVVLAIGDRGNTPPPDGLNAIVLLFLILGIGACLGTQTAYAVNPARDLGPRLMTYCMGYGTEVWNYRNQYWLWTPIIAVFCGGIMGGFIYDSLIYTGSDSPMNRKWSLGPWGSRKHKIENTPANERNDSPA